MQRSAILVIGLKMIISGGQTGADRAALDAALDSGFPCGGWCPEGRVAADGVISNRYPLKELAGAGYRQRTIRNLTESDATAIICFGDAQGGTKLTLSECIRRKKPYLLIDASAVLPLEAAQLIRRFVLDHAASVLNVAGPSHQREPRAYAYVYAVIAELLKTE